MYRSSLRASCQARTAAERSAASVSSISRTTGPSTRSGGSSATSAVSRRARMSPSRTGLSRAASQRRLSSRAPSASGLRVSAEPKLRRVLRSRRVPTRVLCTASGSGRSRRAMSPSRMARHWSCRYAATARLTVRGAGLDPIAGEQPVQLALQRGGTGVRLAEDLGDRGQQVLVAGRAELDLDLSPSVQGGDLADARAEHPVVGHLGEQHGPARPAAGWHSGSW